MVMLRLLSVAAVLSAATAQITISKPSTDSWWVAGSENTLKWACGKDATKTAFTVSIKNERSAAPIDIIAVQQDYDCSKTITKELNNQIPGTGYTVVFANTLNRTDIWGTSETFEIKAAGSAFPQQDSPAGAASSSGSPTGTAAAVTESQPTGSNASRLQASVGLLAASIALAL